MSQPDVNAAGFVVFGPDANCTIALCPIEWSVYEYRPSLPVNIVFAALFGIAMAIHAFIGFRWKSWWFMSCMIWGCLFEIAGYVGRIIMYNNPWSFIAFLIQIIFITTGPVFYTAAIYVTLGKTITAFSPELSRFNPKLIIWVFIPLDVVCLSLQAAGGALSSTSSGSSSVGVDVSLAGLGLQVASLVAFSAIFADYLIRYIGTHGVHAMTLRVRMFFASLTTAVILILARCAYRCQELSQGYQNSDVITDEGLFIGLEGVLIIVSVFALCIGHPGLVFGTDNKLKRPYASTSEEEGIEFKPRGA